MKSNTEAVKYALKLSLEEGQFNNIADLLSAIKAARLLTTAGISKTTLVNILHHPCQQPVALYLDLARKLGLDEMKVLKLVVKE